MEKNAFYKSDIGAQAAWKGFSSQTLYIADRLLADNNNEYYPEDIEDLVIKQDGIPIEAIQVKNISSNLTLSSLASSDTSAKGDGFFKRMCSLHVKYPEFSLIRIVHFGLIGAELQQLANGDDATKAILTQRLQNKHQLSEEDALWLINSLVFEKANIDDLQSSIQRQIKTYVPTMAAPLLAQDLLIQYISQLSKDKGYTTLNIWKEKIHEIGINISAIDGFYKEYNKSLVCLSELTLRSNREQLQKEFSQGVSAHPSHIRLGLDYRRTYWQHEIHKAICDNSVVLVKGVSGQGKTTLCYRYLIDNYPEGCVFCVRTIQTEEQARNLVVALDGLGKHNTNIVVYIDVQPGETLWAFLLQELQSRGLSIPVLISIRDEDYNTTPLNGKAIKLEILDLSLSKDEAEYLYNTFTQENPHSSLRTFAEAWQLFGGNGPLIEFVYLLTNNQTLKQRLRSQVDSLLQQGVSDSWLELLQLVCFTGRLGCSVSLAQAKQVINCTNMQAAIRRFKDEYLIRIVNDDALEALHPVRAQIVFDILSEFIGSNDITLIHNALSCVASPNIRLMLLDFFSMHEYHQKDIHIISTVNTGDWLGFANVIRSMLWLDAKRYVDKNMPVIQALVKKHGKGWLCFLPLDLSGIDRPNELIADGMKDLEMFDSDRLQKSIDEVKNSLSSLSIDYEATDLFLKNSTPPSSLPSSDEERTAFGYALFWMAQRNIKIQLPFNAVEIAMSVSNGALQPSADAIRGLYSHQCFEDSYTQASDILIERLISEMSVLFFDISESEVVCKFIPPLQNREVSKDNKARTNNDWCITMLNILKQIYPDKEYINVELIGVDLLRDVGVKALDKEKRIHKSRRPNTWVAELNGWTKIRIDYSLRPTTWNEYVSEIDKIRKDVYELMLDTLKLIEDLYKKGHYTKERWTRVADRMKVFRTHTFAENRLPHFTVDPYCLYSEGNTHMPAAEFYPMRQLLSVKQYERFRKKLNEVYSSLDIFYSNFIEILLVRLTQQDIGNVKNPNLAMYNLFLASKAMKEFQEEYDLLFSRYSSLSGSFPSQECEALITLLNVWRHVLDNPAKGTSITYDAKIQFRKGSNYFKDTLAKAVTEVKGTLIESECYSYIVVACPISEESTIETNFMNTILRIRNVFKDAILPSSNRWYVETQSKRLAYVPQIWGSCIPVAFSISFYDLFDAEGSWISTHMIPCEIAPELSDWISSTVSQQKWIKAIQSISALKTHLQRFMQVIQAPISDNCHKTRENFIGETVAQVKMLQSEVSECALVIDALISKCTDEEREILTIVQSFMDSYDDIVLCVENQVLPDSVMSTIDIIVASMMYMQQYVDGII